MPVRLLIPLLLIAALTTGGCEPSVDAIVGDERPFTIYGFLDALADTQKVRVFSIESRLGLDRPGDIDAAVTLTDLDTQEQWQWRHKTVTYEDGATGHIFWSPYTPVFNHTYRLDVTRADGATSSATVKIPPAYTFHTPDDVAQLQLRFLLAADAPNLINIRTWYDVSTVPPFRPWPEGTPTPLPVRYPIYLSYDGEQERTSEGIEIQVRLHEDFGRIQQAFDQVCLLSELISLRRIEFSMLVANDEWVPPGGVFDPEVLIEPGTFTNIDNGLGFYGAGYTLRFRWTPPLAVMQQAGFTFDAPCSMFPAPECTLHPPPCFPEEEPDLF